MSATQIDIRLEDELWQKKFPGDDFLKNLLTIAQIPAKAPSRYELSIMLTSDENIRRLNLQYRGKDSPTNILSFPQNDFSPAQTRSGPHLGDLVLAFETIEREATTQGKTFGQHLAHLVIHGFLHLLGYNHQDDSRAREMEKLETDILHAAGYPDPYAPELLRNE